MAEEPQLDADRDLTSTRRNALKTAIGAATATTLGAAPVTAQTAGGDPDIVGEVGVLSFSQPDRGTFFRRGLEQTYTDPVVIMKPVGSVGDHPAHIRLRNISSNSFEYQVEEWSSTDGPHREVRVSYLVVEAGNHSIAGQTVEAGTTRTDSTFSAVELDSEFTSPVVFSQSQTVNDPEPIVTRNRVVSSDGITELNILLQEEMAASGDHADEEVGYVIMEAGTGSVEKTTSGDRSTGVPFEVGKTDEVVDHTPTTIPLSVEFDSLPRFIADMQTYSGDDTAQTRLSELTTDDASFFIEEETTESDRVTHALEESVGYFAIGDAGVLGESSDSDDTDDRSDSGSPYTDDEGYVDSEGLLDAGADYRNGEINEDRLSEVASAFRSGEPLP